MRIVLADRQARVRKALRVLLSQQPGVEVAAEAATAADLVAQCRDACPDLVVLEWELPGLPETGSLATLHHLCPALTIVVLGSQARTEAAALNAGAAAFVSKSDPPERLLDTLHTRRAGESA